MVEASKLWTLIDQATGNCHEFTAFDPQGRFAGELRWLEVPASLAPWVNSEYAEQDGEISPPSLVYLQAQVKKAVTSTRWQRETGGITLANGMTILTAKDDQSRVNEALTNMERYGLASVDFKATSGWIAASYDDVKAIGAAMTVHVQACFTAEKDHHAAIDALDSVDAVANYDYTVGWPGAAL